MAAGGLVCRNQYVVVGCVCCVVSGAAPVCGVVLWFVLVVDGGGGPPGSVPIPVAKPIHADGTAPGGVWESRLPPTRILQYILGCGVYPAWGRLWFWAGAPHTPFRISIPARDGWAIGPAIPASFRLGLLAGR